MIASELPSYRAALQTKNIPNRKNKEDIHTNVRQNCHSEKRVKIEAMEGKNKKEDKNKEAAKVKKEKKRKKENMCEKPSKLIGTL